MVSDDKDALSNAFNLMPLAKNELVVHDAPPDETESYDMETARQNIHHLLQKGEYALNEMIDLAVQKQEARSYEVLTNLIKCLADVNKDLIHLQEKKRQLAIKDEVPNKVVNTQNVIVGSTAELIKMMNEINKK